MMYCLYEILVSLLGFQSFIHSIHYPLRGLEHKVKKHRKKNFCTTRQLVTLSVVRL